jgi:hypothetical protein
MPVGSGSGRGKQARRDTHQVLPAVLASGRPAWEAQPRETERAYGAWQRYRDMGDGRSYGAVAAELGKSKRLVERWALQWCWQARLAAWLREVDRRKIAAHFDAIEKMSERQARQAVAAAQVLTQPALELIKRIQEDPLLLRTIPVDVLFALVLRVVPLLGEVFEAERLARGIATPVDVRVSGNVEHEHQHDHYFVRSVLDDPSFARGATQLFGRLAQLGAGDAGGAGISGDGKALAAGATPTQPE